MSDFKTSTIDFVRELRLRQWARKHFVPHDARRVFWHPVVLDEMRRRDQELSNDDVRCRALNPAEGPLTTNVPLAVPVHLQESVPVFLQAVSLDDNRHVGSAFVPLAPTSSWEFDHFRSAVPKPHSRLVSNDLRTVAPVRT